MQVEWREDGRKLRRSLRHRDWAKAKTQADEIAAWLAEPVPTDAADAEPAPLTIKTLFDIYGEEVTPTKAKGTRKHDRATMRMFLRFFGKHRKAATLSHRDWDRFIRARRAGRAGRSGKPAADSNHPAGPEAVAGDPQLGCKVTGRGGQPPARVESAPGLKMPSEKNPTRVILTQAEYEGLLRVAEEVEWRSQVALVLARETGHRIGAIRQLRWSDIDLDARMIRWRGEHEKTGYEHRTPITAMAQAVLVEARRHNPGIGDAPVMPAPKDPFTCMGRSLACDWWKKAEKREGLDPKRGRGWHSLRREFASDLMDLPLKVLCDPGGWKTAQTVLQCYQRPDEDRLSKALEEYRETGSTSN